MTETMTEHHLPLSSSLAILSSPATVISLFLGDLVYSCISPNQNVRIKELGHKVLVVVFSFHCSLHLRGAWQPICDHINECKPKMQLPKTQAHLATLK